MSVKVSVIIPIYNMQKYIKQCLKSVLNQDLKDIEVLCIDDGSTDNSGRIIEKYAKKEPRIRIIKQANKGVAEARNRGIKEAKGKYVSFLDPDDYLPSNDILSLQYKNAENHHVMIAGGQFSDFDASGKINCHYSDTMAGYIFEKEGVWDYADYQFDYGYHRFIYNKKFLLDNQIMFPGLIRYQDPPFMVNAFAAAGKFYACKKITYCYRINHQRINWDENRVLDLLEGIEWNIAFARNNNLTRLYDISLSRMMIEHSDIIAKQYIQSIKVKDKVESILKNNGLAYEFIDKLMMGHAIQINQIENSYRYKVGNALLCIPRITLNFICKIFRK